MSSIAYTLAQRRLLAVEEVVEQWQLDHAEATLAHAADDLVAEVVNLADTMERLHDRHQGGLQPDTPPQQVAAAHLVVHLLTRTLSLFPRVRALVRHVRGRGYVVPGIDALDRAEAKLSQYGQALGRLWMVPDERRVQTAMQELEQGQYHVL